MRWFLTKKKLLIGFAWWVIHKSMGDDLNFALHIRDLQQLKSLVVTTLISFFQWTRKEQLHKKLLQIFEGLQMPHFHPHIHKGGNDRFATNVHGYYKSTNVSSLNPHSKKVEMTNCYKCPWVLTNASTHIEKTKKWDCLKWPHGLQMPLNFFCILQ